MEEDIETALSIFTKAGLKLSLNGKRELTELVTDIAERDGLNFEQVLLSPEILALISNQKLNGPQKLAKIKEVLFGKRYPIYAKAKALFNKQLKDLKLSPKIKVTPTPFFEGKKVKVEFAYENLVELQEILSSLKKLQGVDLVKNALEAAEDHS